MSGGVRSVDEDGHGGVLGDGHGQPAGSAAIDFDGDHQIPAVGPEARHLATVPGGAVRRWHRRDAKPRWIPTGVPNIIVGSVRRVSAATEPPTAASWPPGPGGTWIIDLDGVVWLAGEPIVGVPEGLSHLRAAGVRPLFASNNSSLTVGEVVTRLRRAGVKADPDEVVTSAQAGAELVEPGSTVLALAGPGVLEALVDRRATPVAGGPADAVMVGFTRDFDFARLAEAADTVRAGARLIGTND